MGAVPLLAAKAAICVAGITYNVLSALTVLRLIQLRDCLHVFNRDLPTALMGTACLIIATNSGLARAWAVLTGRTDTYAGVQRMQLLGLSLCMTVLPAVACSRLHIVVVKFREAGASLDDTGWTAKLLRVLVPDLRTRTGHFKYMAGVVCLALVAWALLMEYSHHLCLRVCKQELPVYGAPWLFAIIPTGFIMVVVTRCVMELSKLGIVEEGLGIFQELKHTIAYASSAGCLACLLIILMDLGLLDQSWELVVQVSWLLCEFNFLWITGVRVASPTGYLPCFFCFSWAKPSSSSSKVAPLMHSGASGRRPLLVRNQESSKHLLRSAEARLGRTLSESQEASPMADLSVLLIMLEGMAAEQPSRLEDTYRVARHLLSEEAVRCAVTVARAHLLEIAIIANRESLRRCWKGIIEDHLKEGARYPVCIKEQARMALCSELERACRRKILFPDDCQVVNRTLVDKLLRELSPVVEPALATFLASYGPPSRAPEKPEEPTLVATIKPMVEASPDAKDELDRGPDAEQRSPRPRVSSAWSAPGLSDADAAPVLA